jgi:hypothetical protein
MKLNEELVSTARDLLTKEDRITLADQIGVQISMIYPILQGVREINKRQYDALQKYIKAAKTERT